MVNIEEGDIFTGTLREKFDGFTKKRVYSIIDFPDRGLRFVVRTCMGWYDLGCLSYRDLRDGLRYRFEIVRRRKANVVMCRALGLANDNKFSIERVDESMFREKKKYEVGQERVVVPSKSDSTEGHKLPNAIFFDHYYRNITGVVFFDEGEDFIVRDLIGDRIHVRVNEVEPARNSRKDVHAVYLRRAD